MRTSPWCDLKHFWPRILELSGALDEAREGAPTSADMTAEGNSNLIGTAGEVLFSLLSGLDMNTEVYENHGDGHYDFVLRNLLTVQVKTTPYPKTALWVYAEQVDRRQMADIYTLVQLNTDVKDKPHARVLGWCLAFDVANPKYRKHIENVKHPGYRYILDYTELRPWSTFPF